MSAFKPGNEARLVGQSVRSFLKREPVLILSGILAVISMFFVPPSSRYAQYIDFKTLGILFCLMACVAGLTKAGIFDRLAAFLAGGSRQPKTLILLLTLLCFASAMVLTNDVALITFVPLTILLLKGVEGDCLLFAVSMETIGANLGSMLTPVGNPQNLYLFSHYGLKAGEFFRAAFPVWAMGLLLVVLTVMLYRLPQKPVAALKSKVAFSGRAAALYGGLFLLSLLCVFRIIPLAVSLAITILSLLAFDRRLFRGIDYSLLLTFVGFFVLIGNLGSLEGVRIAIETLLTGRETLVSALVSQVISNVPAALMLSGFTENWKGLLVGTNIGGLGTLIASMASLISFRLYSKSEGAKPGRYLLFFTGLNVLFLLILCTAALLLRL